MFDFVTRRRLTIIVLALLFVILSILFLHRIRPSSRQYVSPDKKDTSQVSNCHETEPSDVITLCQKCTSYERRFQAEACSRTGYKEVVLCSTSNIQTARSCRIPTYVRTQQFWYFEGFVFLVALIAVASVQSRQKALEKQLVEKIRRQIGESDEWVQGWSVSKEDLFWLCSCLYIRWWIVFYLLSLYFHEYIFKVKSENMLFTSSRSLPSATAEKSIVWYAFLKALVEVFAE